MQLNFILICFALCSTRVIASTFKHKVLSFLPKGRHSSPPPQDPTQEQASLLREKQIAEHVKGLMDGGKYDKVIKFCGNLKKHEFLKHICPTITTPDHYLGLFKYLQRRDVLVGFFVQGNMPLVRKAIVEFKDSLSDQYIHDGPIKDAIILSLTEDRYERFIGLLRAVQWRFAKMSEQGKLMAETSKFKDFMHSVFLIITSKKYNIPLRRFLTLHKEEFKKHPNTFEIFYRRLVSHLGKEHPTPNSKQLLFDLTEQPSLLTTDTFIKALLRFNNNTKRRSFIIYCWREAMAKGLEEGCSGGYKGLWGVMVKEFPERFSGEYPSTDEALQAVLAKFPTNKELKEAWRQRERELTLMLTAIIPLPPDLLNIISAYSPLLMGRDKMIA